ncbi:MAG: DUF5915 domain-containing protein, partial [Christensenellaceae bacterium]|nr:DUF5915 domain-containing protein [Christensenellaceae bacterium]
ALGRAARNAASLKIRQPLSKLYLKGAEGLSDEMAALVLEELNVKQMELTEDTRAFTSYALKPQMRTLGPKYGKLLGAIGQFLQQADGNAAVDALNEAGRYAFTLNGTQIELSREDLLISPAQKPGFVAESEGGMTVVLDANLSPELIAEGYVREVVSKVQTMRKEAGFEVIDRVLVYFSGLDAGLLAALRAGESSIAQDVLASALLFEEAPGDAYKKDWDINGKAATIAVKKA